MIVDDNNIVNTDYEEIEKNNQKEKAEGHPENVIDLSAISICRTIRNLARTRTIKVRDDAHTNKNARNLISYLEYCGIGLDDYMTEYLKNLQPYMIERNKREEYSDDIIAILDKVYNISIYIKLNKGNDNSNNVTIVSFHEDYTYKNGKPISTKNSVIKHENEQYHKAIYVPVFKDSYASINQNDHSAFINIYAQRGLLTLKLSVPTKLKCKDVYIVRKSDIEQNFIQYCNTYIEDLYASDLNIADKYSAIQPFTMLQQVSFTSYGKDSFSSLSLLIDSLLEQRDMLSKAAADFAITTYAANLRLNENDKEELLLLLDEKYKIINSPKIPLLIDRVKKYIEMDNPTRYIVKKKSQLKNDTEEEKNKNDGISYVD